MLTFFEYLRQRPFESVVAGVQDALDLLEKETDGAPSSEPLRQPDKGASLNLLRQAATPDQASDGQPTRSDTNTDAPPKPRPSTKIAGLFLTTCGIVASAHYSAVGSPTGAFQHPLLGNP